MEQLREDLAVIGCEELLTCRGTSRIPESWRSWSGEP